MGSPDEDGPRFGGRAFLVVCGVLIGLVVLVVMAFR